MKKKFLTIIGCLLVVATLASLAAIFVGCSDSKDYIETKTKQITVGITSAAPMNYKDSSGKWIGFDTELTLTIFNALGYDVMFKEIVWKNKFLELEAGTINCIWNGFTKNSTETVKDADGKEVEKDRSEFVNFSMNYMTNEQCLVKNKNVEFKDETSFKGKTITYETASSGDTGVGWFEEEDWYEENKFIRKGMPSQSEALRELNLGTADFAVVDKSLALNMATTNENIEITDYDYFELEYYAIGFAKTAEGAALRDKVDILLNALYQTGYLKELAEKYNIDYAVRIQPLFQK